MGHQSDLTDNQWEVRFHTTAYATVLFVVQLLGNFFCWGADSLREATYTTITNHCSTVSTTSWALFLLVKSIVLYATMNVVEIQYHDLQ